MFSGGVASRSLLFAKQSSSSKENPTMISNHLLEPLVSSTPKKNITRCLDLFDSDSSFSSDFGTPAKLPRTESPTKCWIDLNDTDTSEQNDLSLKQSWKNRACTNVFDRESKEQVSKGKLSSKMRLKQHSPPFSMFLVGNHSDFKSIPTTAKTHVDNCCLLNTAFVGFLAIS